MLAELNGCFTRKLQASRLKKAQSRPSYSHDRDLAIGVQNAVKCDGLLYAEPHESACWPRSPQTLPRIVWAHSHHQLYSSFETN
jgi:hypothetical protein